MTDIDQLNYLLVLLLVAGVAIPFVWLTYLERRQASKRRIFAARDRPQNLARYLGC